MGTSDAGFVANLALDFNFAGIIPADLGTLVINFVTSLTSSSYPSPGGGVCLDDDDCDLAGGVSAFGFGGAFGICVDVGLAFGTASVS